MITLPFVSEERLKRAKPTTAAGRQLLDTLLWLAPEPDESGGLTRDVQKRLYDEVRACLDRRRSIGNGVDIGEAAAHIELRLVFATTSVIVAVDDDGVPFLRTVPISGMPLPWRNRTVRL